jgi:RNA polymerase sigma factor (sigma-70 family)
MQKSRNQIYDELLVLKCQQGDKDAFAELVDRWQKRLWSYALRVTGSEPAAWDILQETWLAIIKGIKRLDDVDVFPQWAFRILNNKCVDRLRRQYLQNKIDSELSKRIQNESNIEQNIGEKAESLDMAVKKLEPKCRALLTLRYREGFEIGQIAEILNVPEGTVKSRVHRALNKLREMVERKEND